MPEMDLKDASALRLLYENTALRQQLVRAEAQIVDLQERLKQMAQAAEASPEPVGAC